MQKVMFLVGIAITAPHSSLPDFEVGGTFTAEFSYMLCRCSAAQREWYQ
jgi:hypothetical protein